MNNDKIIVSNLVLTNPQKLNNEGQNSTTLIAHDEQLNADFVVKTVSKPQNQDIQSKWNEYFQEARMIYDSMHPNIVKVQYSSFDEDKIYMAMPFYKNGSLDNLLNKRFLTAREIISISLDVLTGLAHIHSKKILHLDIKPTNILFADNGNAVITDFGQSSYMDEYGIAQNLKGMYWYNFAPENLTKNFFDFKTDIYDVGLLIYRMCCGNDIFQEQKHRYSTKETLKNSIISGNFPDKNFYLPHIPNELSKIVKKALSKDPDKRYSSCIDFMNALSNIEDSARLDIRHKQENDVYIYDYIKDKTHYHAEYDSKTSCLSAYKHKTTDTKIGKLCKDGISQKEAFDLIRTEF